MRQCNVTSLTEFSRIPFLSRSRTWSKKPVVTSMSHMSQRSKHRGRNAPGCNACTRKRVFALLHSGGHWASKMSSSSIYYRGNISDKTKSESRGRQRICTAASPNSGTSAAETYSGRSRNMFYASPLLPNGSCLQ